MCLPKGVYPDNHGEDAELAFEEQESKLIVPQPQLSSPMLFATQAQESTLKRRGFYM